jgi:hypothetical protein
MNTLLLLLAFLLLQESRAFHAQRSRLMQLTDMLAQHVEQHRHPLSSNSSSGGGCSSSGGSSSPGRGGDTAAAAAGAGGEAAAAKHTAGIDSSLVGCLANLREPGSGKLFDHKVGPVTILTAVNCCTAAAVLHLQAVQCADGCSFRVLHVGGTAACICDA